MQVSGKRALPPEGAGKTGGAGAAAAGPTTGSAESEGSIRSSVSVFTYRQGLRSVHRSPHAVDALAL